MRRLGLGVVVALAVGIGVAVAVGQSGDAGSSGPGSTEATDLVLSSPDLDARGLLPQWSIGRATGFCDGENRSPELRWRGAPEGTEAFVLTMTDPAFPSYTHWVVTDIPGHVTRLEQAPDGAVGVGVVGRSSAGVGGYTGPCRAGNPYVYTLYALDVEIGGEPRTTLAQAEEAIAGHVLDTATLEVQRPAAE